MARFKIGDVISSKGYLNLKIIGVYPINYKVIILYYPNDLPSKFSRRIADKDFKLTLSSVLKKL